MPGRTSEPVLRVNDLHKAFGPRQVLRGVNLELRQGEILALVGENGAGKSTVVGCVAGTLTPDRGTVEVGGRLATPASPGAGHRDIEVVWQHLALCDNLSVVANLFLGDETVDHGMLDEAGMVAEAKALFARLHIPAANVRTPVGALSGGQRQLVAIAGALRRNPAVLILDEPTGALGAHETAVVERLLAEVRAAGTPILLVSHQLDQVFGLADRIAVLRDGHILADVSALEVHPDDVLALMSGIETDSAARRQLRRLRSLVEQLADVEPAASLPLIVSAMAEALAVDRLCIHLLRHGEAGSPARLERSAALGMPDALLAALESLPVDERGGPPGKAAATGQAVVVDDARTDPLWARFRNAGPTQPRSFWSVPIVGSGGVLGTISGYADTGGRPQADQLELVWLYAGHAAAAIEREHLLTEATRRNRVLETLRGVLDTLAGPQPAQGGLTLALLALCRGLRADAIALHRPDGERSELSPSDLGGPPSEVASNRQRTAAEQVARAAGGDHAVRLVGSDVLAVPLDTPAGRAVVTAWWAEGGRPSDEATDLLGDAARSLRLALEREALEDAHAEAASLRRSQGLQRDFLSRMNHELRTPLTAIQGYASTLRQTDVDWDDSSQRRFLDSIASESARMGRLVGDLLDFSAIDSGTMRLVPDWCDVALVLEAARRCVRAPRSMITLRSDDGLPPVWADHDRLEQVFVNLLDNAVLHASGATHISVDARHDPAEATVTVRVIDDGAGIPEDLGERVFLPHERGATGGPGVGLGLAIARGIVEAHGGTIRLEPVTKGTAVAVVIPVEPSDPADQDLELPVGSGRIGTG
ncbi:MAG TPA: ATP-binding cassette domain-containing protein [Acidimicrobiales bacterium]|jgi:signal transduction histidine kinase/ABC-type sulfate/molybdate transport systems ATPase subunit|nr:ATP-binding cassette domain-containing protein [Acidimicrobiales bacterium]